jgi:tRNA pseudouridine55 synthase
LTVNGILNLDKPRGKTSFEMVSLIRRLSGERKVGHAGTLDPEATGVLPICLGQGTRLVEFLVEGDKTYRAEIELGITTDTYDATGRITGSNDASSVTREQVELVAASFIGTIEQLPPIYSAIKHRGKPLYRWARAGVKVPRRIRKVELSRLEIIDWRPPYIGIEVDCSKGTYIRSLAHDLGQKLGCGASLKNLIRLKSGPFHISTALSISKIEDAFGSGHWRELLHDIDIAVLHLQSITVDQASESAVINGRPVTLPQQNEPVGPQCRAYSSDGQLIAILRRDEEQSCWKPDKVLVKNP